MKRRNLGIDENGLTNEFARLGMLTTLMDNDAGQMERVWVLWMFLQDLSIGSLGLIQSSLAMGIDGIGKSIRNPVHSAYVASVAQRKTQSIPDRPRIRGGHGDSVHVRKQATGERNSANPDLRGSLLSRYNRYERTHNRSDGTVTRGIVIQSHV